MEGHSTSLKIRGRVREITPAFQKIVREIEGKISPVA